MLELLNEFYIGSEKYCTVQIGKKQECVSCSRKGI